MKFEDVHDLLTNVQNLFIEYHSAVDKKQYLGALLSLVGQAGFRYYIEHIGVRSRFPYLNMESYNGFDLQLNIYCFRERTRG